MNSPADVLYLSGLRILQVNRPQIFINLNYFLRVSQKAVQLQQQGELLLWDKF